MNARFPASKSHGGPAKSNDKGMAVVQCEGFRCLAYLDTDNRWRDLQTGKELPQVKEVVHTFF